MQLRTITIQIQIGFAHCRSTSINHHLFWSHWHCGLPGLCGCYSQSIDNMHATHTMPNMARKHISTYLANYIYIERERGKEGEATANELQSDANQLHFHYNERTSNPRVRAVPCPTPLSLPPSYPPLLALQLAQIRNR